MTKAVLLVYVALTLTKGVNIQPNMERKVEFEIVLAVSMKTTDFWVLVSCSPIEAYQHFHGGSKYL
jgi:hypothetical protein